MLCGIFPFVIAMSCIAQITFGVPCEVGNVHKVGFENYGEISSTNCRYTPYTACHCTWTFVDIPSEGNDLILNMTQQPSSPNLVFLNGDPFIDDSDPSYCMVFVKQKLNTKDLQALSKMNSLYSQYPGCRIRSGVQHPVIVTYKFTDIPIPFVIEYEITGNVSTPPPDVTTSPIVTTQEDVTTTIALTSSFEESTIEILTSGILTPSGGVGVASLPQIYIIAIAVAAGALVLIIAVIIMLFVTRRRNKKVRQGENSRNILYDIPQYACIDDFKEIQNGKNGGFTKQEVVKEEVLNPLYSDWSDDSAPVSPISPSAPLPSTTRNSYEYIDIEIGNR